MTKFEGTILFILLIIVFFWLLKWQIKAWTEYFRELFHKESLSDLKWAKNALYSAIIQEVIWYTNDILTEHGIKYFPDYQISYYRHQKFDGKYLDGRIIIYIKNVETSIPSLVSICLHETQHYIDHLTDSNFSRYDEFTEKYGYVKNIYEQRARTFASQHLNECIKHIERKGLIVRV